MAAVANVELTMTPELAAQFDRCRRDIDLMTPVLKTSLRYDDCLAEFAGIEGGAACAEYAEAWEDAVRAYRQASGGWTPPSALQDAIDDDDKQRSEVIP